jgi:glycosyltransferase involved in cell wall biosynthesis
MADICILDDSWDRPATPVFQEALEALGHRTLTVWRSKEDDPAQQKEVSAFNPELVISFQNVAFQADRFFEMDAVRKSKIAILFYDDPVSTLQLFGSQHPFIAKPERSEWFIWDRYWMRQVEAISGHHSFHTHLAADRKYFAPDTKPAIPDLKNHLVFMGNLPSSDHIGQSLEILPGNYRKLAEAVYAEIKRSGYGNNPFESLEHVLSTLPREQREIFELEKQSHMSRRPDMNGPLPSHVQLRRLVWQMGKRETRLRALRVAARQAPLAILSNLKDPSAMKQEEFARELSTASSPGATGGRLDFVDTSQAGYRHLAALYRSGKAHFQTTDPQSVSGGIPLRVFQAAACAVPLISDFKTELGECFHENQEVLIYHDEEEISFLLNEWFEKKHGKELAAVGTAAYKRFLAEHTWEHRLASILKTMNISSSPS